MTQSKESLEKLFNLDNINEVYYNEDDFLMSLSGENLDYTSLLIEEY